MLEINHSGRDPSKSRHSLHSCPCSSTLQYNEVHTPPGLHLKTPRVQVQPEWLRTSQSTVSNINVKWPWFFKPWSRTSQSLHPWRRNVTTSMIGLKNSHIPRVSDQSGKSRLCIIVNIYQSGQKPSSCKNLTQNGEPHRYSWGTQRKKNGEPHRYSWGTQRKKKNGEPQRYSWGTQKKKKNGEPQRYSWGTQRKKNGEPHRYSWGTQKKKKNGEPQRYSWGTQRKKNGEPQRYSWGTQRKKNGEPQRYSWERRRIRRITNTTNDRHQWSMAQVGNKVRN